LFWSATAFVAEHVSELDSAVIAGVAACLGANRPNTLTSIFFIGLSLVGCSLSDCDSAFLAEQRAPFQVVAHLDEKFSVDGHSAY
jgi:hypothetical protein